MRTAVDEGLVDAEEMEGLATPETETEDSPEVVTKDVVTAVVPLVATDTREVPALAVVDDERIVLVCTGTDVEAEVGRLVVGAAEFVTMADDVEVTKLVGGTPELVTKDDDEVPTTIDVDDTAGGVLAEVRPGEVLPTLLVTVEEIITADELDDATDALEPMLDKD